MGIRRFSTSNLSGTKSSKIWDQETTLGTFESISTVLVTTAQSSITFSNIPQGYTDLQLRSYWGFTDTSNNTWLNVQFNGDAGSNYSYHAIRSAAAGFVMSASYATTKMSFGSDVLGNASSWAVSIADIFSYSSTSKNKTVRTIGGYDNNGSGRFSLTSGLWFATPAAITSILLSPYSGNWSTYTSFSLYGIK